MRSNRPTQENPRNTGRGRRRERRFRAFAIVAAISLLTLGFAAAGALARPGSVLDIVTGSTSSSTDSTAASTDSTPSTSTDATTSTDSTSSTTTGATSTDATTTTGTTSTGTTTTTDSTTTTDTTSTTTTTKGPKNAAPLAPVVDQPLPSSVQLYQWEEDPSGGWITGNLGSHNAHYAEGETIPFRLDVSSIPAGSYHYAICRDFTNSGIYGYLKLLPFNTTLNTGDSAGSPVDAISGSGGISAITAHDTGGQGGCPADHIEYDVQFTTDGSAGQFLYWGGYLAKPGDAIPGGGTVAFLHSAGFYPGSSLHMLLLSPGKDRSINPGSIIILSEITVTKFFDGGATPTSFCFTATGPNNFNSTLCTDGTNGASVQFLDLPSGSYTVTEGAKDGYIFNGTDANDVNCTFVGSTATAAVTASTNPQFGTCDFHNKQKASPALSTTPSAGVVVGGTINDLAHLTGGSSPTGSITFNLYGAGDTTCASAPINTSTATVNGNADYTSGNYTTTAPGTYHWRASYSGDGGNNAVALTACADESVVVSKASPGLTTTPSAGVVVGGTVNDVAHLTGGLNPVGTITYNLYGPTDAGCSANPIFTTTKPANGDGNYTSNDYTTTTAGTYHWRVSFADSDGNNNDVALTNCADESVVVAKASPGLTTTPSGSVTVGGNVNDVAHLTGGYNPQGTITFNLYGPTDSTCSSNPVFTDTKAANGNNDYTSGNYPTAAAGTYHWRVSYSGDGNNAAVPLTACADESVVVTKASPGLTTTPSGAVGIGGTVHDTAHLTAGVSPTGTITFNLYGPTDSTCSAAAIFTDTATVNGNNDYTSANYTTLAAGTYHWRASYSGDGNNAAVPLTACADESVVVGKATPSLSTTPSGSVAIGLTVHDTAHLTAGVSPTGTITFNLYGPTDSTCSAAAIFTDTATVNNGNGDYSSGNYATLAAGTYHWRASYSGDGNNAAVPLTACADESVVVTKATTELSTTPSGSVTIGGTVHDTAHLTAGVSPTGTITFNLYGPTDSTCSAAAIFTDTATVNGNNDYTSANYTTLAAGTYHWRASYSGDSNNAAVPLTACADESVVVNKAASSISTTIHDASHNPVTFVDVGSTVHDSANVTGTQAAGVPTGTVTFVFFHNALCTGQPSDTSGALALVNGAVDATSFTQTPAPAGMYAFEATYNGSGSYLSSTSDCEPLTVNQLQPALTTTPSAGGTVGVVLNDSGTLSGAYQPTGTITFKLWGPSNPTCSAQVGSALFSQDVTVSGNGTYHTTGGFTTLAAGTYNWTASYGGDANNKTAASACGLETAVVGKQTPTISTKQSPGGNTGVVLSDSATLAGGASTPQGSILFKLYGPTNATCNSDGAAPVFTDTVQVDGNGTYNTDKSYTTAAAGTYRWVAIYSGDNNNDGAVSGCNEEQVTVTTPSTPGPPTSSPKVDIQITKSATPSPGTVGTNITWTMVVTNNGPDWATGVTVADPIPAGTSFVSVSTTQGSCTGGAIVMCQLGSLPNGASVTITVVTTANATGTLLNTATTVANESETSTTNNSASASVVINAPAAPFKPPVTKPKPRVYCAALAVSPHQLFAGRHAVLTLKVTKHAKGVAGVKIRIKGAGLLIVTTSSNGKGVVKRAVLPNKAGIVTFQPVAQKSCKNPRIGVIGVFTPPVTG